MVEVTEWGFGLPAPKFVPLQIPRIRSLKEKDERNFNK